MSLLLAASALAGPLGLAPLEGPLAEPFVSAGRCAACHRDVVDDWADSRHRASWTNELFFEGYVDETLPFCVPCHAPLASQSAEVLANTAFYASRDPRSGVAPGSAPLGPEPTAAEGVTCAVCHVRGGRLVVAEPSPAHPDAVVDPALRDPALCGACHDFPFAAAGPRGTVLTDDPMQATLAEWRAWAEAGGRETCADCHLPGGRHTFRGAHDQVFLRDALSVRPVDGGLVLASRGVGHALPTGDLFRHLTVEVLRGETWEEVARIGRTFRTWYDAALDLERKGSDGDTRLFPGEERRVDLPPGAAWRVRYHYGSALDERRGRLPDDALFVVLHEGRAP